MDKFNYSSINENVYHEVLSNGLEVYLVKKEGYAEKCAYFGTKFGSFQTGGNLIDENGNKHLVLGGIAHFLEHRLFDYYKGNVMDLYDELGADTNAFTSYNKTVYYFSTIENFDKCLNLLLDFPSTFKMSEEAVEKEKDIIVQELLMYKDMPDEKIFNKTMNNLYFDHPIKFDVGGEPEEVRATNRELLRLCQQTFYSSSNMVLTVVGDINIEETMNLIKENQKDKHFDSLDFDEKIINENYDSSVKEYEEIEDESVNNDKLMIAYKVKPFTSENAKKQLCMEFISSLLFSSSTDFYDNLIKNEIASGISSSFMSYKDLNCFEFDCDTTDANKVIELVKERMNKCLDYLDEEELEDLKKCETSFITRSCNSCNTIAKLFILYFFEDINYFNLIDIIKDIHVSDLKEVYEEYLKTAPYTITVLKGKNND